MKLRRKFTLEIILLTVVLFAASLIIINNTLTVEKNFSTLNDDLIPRLSLLKDMRLLASNVLVLTLELTIFENNFIMTDQEISKIDLSSSDVLFEIEQNKIHFDQLFDLYMHHVLETPTEDSASKIHVQWEKFKIISDKFIDYQKRGISDESIIKIKNEFKDSKSRLFAEIDSLLLLNEKEIEQKNHSVSELVTFSTIVILFVVFVFAVVLIILRHYILKSILTPISNIRNVTREIAKDNLNIRIDDISKDEIGELSVDINIMTREIESIQNKLLKSEKLSVVGVLASRMAHDIRNPLAIIVASLETLKLKYKNIEDEKFNKINNAVNCITHQVEDVMDFIQISPLFLENTSLLVILRTILDSKTWSDGVDVVLPSNDLVIDCDPRKMRVVFVNLLLNAVDAMDNLGEIKIRFHDFNKSIKIEIEDSGLGLESADLKHIFEPLFTTKQKGTGLGLASVESIVKQHGGTISVSSPPTIFTIVLPKILD